MVLLRAEYQVPLVQLTSLARLIQADQVTALLLVSLGWLSLPLERSLVQSTSLARLKQADRETALALVSLGWLSLPLAHALAANWLLLLTALLTAENPSSEHSIQADQGMALLLVLMGWLAHASVVNWLLLVMVLLMAKSQVPLVQSASLARLNQADQATALQSVQRSSNLWVMRSSGLAHARETWSADYSERLSSWPQSAKRKARIGLRRGLETFAVEHA
jgi:hypothetical protein